MTGRRSWLLVAVLVLLAWVAGTYRETRHDGGAWCVHFEYLMVCNQATATDYVLNTP